jgi:uncharacterized membrane protein
VETRKRSLVKSVTWRAIGVVVLGLVTWMVTRNWKQVSVITLVFESTQIVLYYLHERTWLKVKWGRIRHPLEEIEVKGNLSSEDLEEVRAKLRALGYLD